MSETNVYMSMNEGQFFLIVCPWYAHTDIPYRVRTDAGSFFSSLPSYLSLTYTRCQYYVYYENIINTYQTRLERQRFEQLS